MADVIVSFNQDYTHETAGFFPKGSINVEVDEAVAADAIAAGAASLVTNFIPAAAGPLAGLTSINGGPLAGLRNQLINPAFTLWWEGTSFASGASQRLANRWKGRRAGNVAGATFSRQAGLLGAQYTMRMQRDVGNSSTGIIYLAQQIESVNCYGLAGKPVMISVDLAVGADYSGGQVRVELKSGTGVDETVSEAGGFATGGVTVGSTPKSITTTPTRYSFGPYTVPADASELALMLRWTPGGTAGANDYIDVTDVQLEVSDVATPFEARPAALEEMLALRYLEKIEGYGGTNNHVFGAAAAINATDLHVILEYAPKRVAPTLAFSGAFAFRGNNGQSPVTYSTNFNPTRTRGRPKFTGTFVQGHAGLLVANADTAASVLLVAEL